MRQGDVRPHEERAWQVPGRTNRQVRKERSGCEGMGSLVEVPGHEESQGPG